MNDLESGRGMSIIICDNSYLLRERLGQDNPFFFGVEALVWPAVDFAADHLFAFGMAEADTNLFRRVSARRIEGRFNSALRNLRFIFNGHRAKVGPGVLDAAGLAVG